MNTPFGASLKHWRTQRRMSQLDLGLTANVSARHISFLETGRSSPSRSMVLQLCEQLDVPRAVRNTMLNQAGLAAAYESRELSHAEMQPVRAAIDWMLKRHDPFPALAVDRHWTIVEFNAAAERLLAGMGLGRGANGVQMLIESKALQEAVINLPEVVMHLKHRLLTESAHYGGDPVLDRMAQDLGAIAADGEAVIAPAIMPAFVPTQYRFGETELSLLSTFAQFGSAQDIALGELRIEMMFPADTATRETLLALGA